jgi:putative FmdB family regulatory protein
MPIFEYRCEPCEKQFESFVMSHSEHVTCPSCQGEVKKLMSTFASVVPGGYKSSTMSGGGASASDAPAAPKAGGHGGGSCACH